MDEDTRNMKHICNILHDVRRSNGGNVMFYGDIDAVIATAEKVYHGMKEV